MPTLPQKVFAQKITIVKSTYYKLYSKSENMVSATDYPTRRDCEEARKIKGGDWVCEYFNKWGTDEKQEKPNPKSVVKEVKDEVVKSLDGLEW